MSSGRRAARSTPAGPVSREVFEVTGMTCAHCVTAVREELGALAGVTGVEVELVAGGTSTVSVASAVRLDRAAVAEAVAEAGYALTTGAGEPR